MDWPTHVNTLASGYNGRRHYFERAARFGPFADMRDALTHIKTLAADGKTSCVRAKRESSILAQRSMQPIPTASLAPHNEPSRATFRAARVTVCKCVMLPKAPRKHHTRPRTYGWGCSSLAWLCSRSCVLQARPARRRLAGSVRSCRRAPAARGKRPWPWPARLRRNAQQSTIKGSRSRSIRWLPENQRRPV